MTEPVTEPWWALHRTVLVTVLVATLCLPLTLRIHPWPLAVATLGVVLVCTVGAVRASAPVCRPMAMIFWAFLGIWLGVGSLYQLATNTLAWGDVFRYADPLLNLQGQLLTLTALAAFALGSHLARRPVPLTVLPDVVPRRPTPGPRAAAGRRALHAWHLPALYVGLAIAMLPVVVAASGGFGSLFQSRQERTEAFSRSGLLQAGREADGLLRILPAGLALAGAYVGLLVWLHRRRLRRAGRPSGSTVVPAVVTLVGIAGMVLYANPFSMSRYISVSAFAALALVVWRPRTSRGGLVLLGWAVVGLLLVYPLAYTFRGMDRTTEGADSWWAVLASNDFDGYQQVINGLQFVAERGYGHGIYLFSALLYFVPRSVWPDKATPASLDVAANRGYVFVDLGQPLHSEFFLDFGVLGMVLLMLLVGAAWRRLDDAWHRSPTSGLARVVPYACVAQIGLLRGPLGSLVPVAMTTFLLLTLAVHISSREQTADAVGSASRSPRGVRTDPIPAR